MDFSGRNQKGNKGKTIFYMEVEHVKRRVQCIVKGFDWAVWAGELYARDISGENTGYTDRCKPSCLTACRIF